MFEQTFVKTQAQTRGPWTVAVSLSVQCLVVGVLLLIPLLHPDMLQMPGPPQPHLISTWITQPPLRPQKTGARTPTISTPPLTRPLFVPPNFRNAPASQSVAIPSSDPELTAWSGPSGASFGPLVPGSVALPPRTEVKPPPAPPATKLLSAGPIRVSSDVTAAQLVFGPHPAYPPLAIATRSQGVVKLAAVIATDGTIRNLRVVSGPPLLVDAALKAVQQWRYRPTLLNGVAVEVLTEIDVNFSLMR